MEPPRKLNKAQRNRRDFIADIRFMLWTGETHIETIAKRAGTTPGNLERRLAKAGRHDLLRRMTGIKPAKKVQPPSRRVRITDDLLVKILADERSARAVAKEIGVCHKTIIRVRQRAA